MTGRSREAQPAAERVGAQAEIDDAGTSGGWTLLWALLGAGVAWALHLLVSYTVLAWACTTERTSLARTLLLGVSAAALLAAAASGWTARRRWMVARERDRPEDDAWDARMGERTARVSFLMVAGLVLAVLFAIAIAYATITLFFVPLCEPGGQA
jgi:Flp pilus assembly protein TadB